MGTDNLFHKRNAKKVYDLKRRKATRLTYEKVLIVCEGEKTEPNYFQELIDYYKISSAEVRIDGNCGSSPKCVFKHAVELFNYEKKKGDSFDRVYCVIDKDNHDSYEEVLKTIALKRPKGIFFVSNTVPCFEYWLLLHYKYTTKPFSNKGNSSIANEVLKELIKEMPNYTKGANNIFVTLLSQLNLAKSNAIRSLGEARKNHTDNPTTHIHKLVSYLQKIKIL